MLKLRWSLRRAPTFLDAQLLFLQMQISRLATLWRRNTDKNIQLVRTCLFSPLQISQLTRDFYLLIDGSRKTNKLLKEIVIETMTNR